MATEYTTSLESIRYPTIPAEEPALAITDSNVSLFGVNHFTKAKDVNENRKLSAAAHITAGPITGIQRCFILENLLLPPGSNESCSSHRGSRVESVGSTNRIIRDKLNQA